MRRFLNGLAAVSLSLVLLAVPVWGQSKVDFDLAGKSGANPDTLIPLTSITSQVGNACVEGGGNAAVGKSVTARFQFLVMSFQTDRAFANEVMVAGPNQRVIVKVGENYVNTGNQFIITGMFEGVIRSIENDGATVVIGPNLGAGANLVRIFCQSATDPNSASYNDTTGNGYDTRPSPPSANRKLVAQGHVVAAGFTSSFHMNADSMVNPAANLNGHPVGRSSFQGVKTPVGSGNSSLTVVLDTAAPEFFPRPDPNVLPVDTLYVGQVPTGLPVTGCAPIETYFDGAKPNVGPINGRGADIVFQAGPATLSFGNLTSQARSLLSR